MATHALNPAYRRVSVEEFLEMDFHGAKAELEDGIIFMMARGSTAHARVAGNIFAYLHMGLRGSGCRPLGSDFATRTEEHTIRYPDVSVHCGSPFTPDNDRKKLLGDPRVVFEILSPSTSAHDQFVKLNEYRALSGVHEIVFVDPDQERIRLVRRTGAENWTDDWLTGGDDLALPSLALTLPHAEIFARD